MLPSEPAWRAGSFKLIMQISDKQSVVERNVLDISYFTCRKSTTRNQRLSFHSERSHTHDFYTLKKSIDPGRVRTREPRIQWRV